MVAGVCGGIAEYFGIDSTLVRVAYVILGIMTTGFPALLVYIMLAFIMPEY